MDLFTLAAKLKLDSSGFESAMRKATNTGKSFGQKMEKSFGKVAKAAKAVFSVVAIRKATNAVMNFAGTVAKAGDTIDKQSQALGISRKAYQEWGYILSQTGGSIDSMGVSMKTLNQAILSGGKDTEEALKEIGLSSKELQGLSQEDAFERVVRAFQKMPAGAQKSAAAVKLFGRNGMELLPLLNSDIYTIDVLRAKANELGLVMSDDAVNASVAYTDALDTLGRTLNALKYSIGAKILPALTRGMEKLTLYINKLRKAYERGGFKEVVKTMWDDFKGAVQEKFTSLKIKLAEILNIDAGNQATWVDIALNVPKWMFKGIKDYVAGKKQTIAGLLGFVDDKGNVLEDTSWADIGVKLIEKIKESIQRTVREARITLAGLLGFTDINGKVLEDTSWGEIGKKIIDGLTSAVKKGGSFLQRLILGEEYVEGETEWKHVGEKILKWISEAFQEGGFIDTLLKNGLEKATAIAEFAGGLIVEIAQWIADHSDEIAGIISSIVQAFVKALPAIVDAFSTILPALVDALVQIIQDPNFQNAVFQLVKTIITALAAGLNSLLFDWGSGLREAHGMSQAFTDRLLNPFSYAAAEIRNKFTMSAAEKARAEETVAEDVIEVMEKAGEKVAGTNKYGFLESSMYKDLEGFLLNDLQEDFNYAKILPYLSADTRNAYNRYLRYMENPSMGLEKAGLNPGMSQGEIEQAIAGSINSDIAYFINNNGQIRGSSSELGSVLVSAKLDLTDAQNELDRTHLSAPIDVYLGKWLFDGSHASGLASVPYDGYVAQLHRGKRVLTASQARHQEQGYGTAEIVGAIQSLRNDMQNLKLVVGRRTFGRAVVDYGGNGMDGYIGRSENKLAAGYGS